MKNNAFWKVCAVVFLVLMTIWIWSQCVYFIQLRSPDNGAVYGCYRINRITGAVHLQYFMGDKEIREKGWQNVREYEDSK